MLRVVVDIFGGEGHPSERVASRSVRPRPIVNVVALRVEARPLDGSWFAHRKVSSGTLVRFRGLFPPRERTFSCPTETVRPAKGSPPYGFDSEDYWLRRVSRRGCDRSTFGRLPMERIPCRPDSLSGNDDAPLTR